MLRRDATVLIPVSPSLPHILSELANDPRLEMMID
jgi:hypothetical protein